MTAPTTPTGTLTVHDVFVADLNAAIDAVAQHYDACERAGGGDADDDFDAATLCFTLLRRHGVKLRALAAGQAHPQGQGEPVDRPPPQPCCGKWDTCERWCLPLIQHWRGPNIATAAQGQVSASVAPPKHMEGCICSRWLASRTCPIHGDYPTQTHTAPPHAGQEPDAYTQTLMREPHRYTNRSPGTYEDHALIVALQAQHEADAARIAELERDNTRMKATCADRQKWRSRMGLTPSVNAFMERAETAEAALAQAVALLREMRHAEILDDDNPRLMAARADVDAFLASAKADERSDGQASREGAK